MFYNLFEQKEANKSKGNLVEDEGLDWLKPRALIKPDDQEEVPDAVRPHCLIPFVNNIQVCKSN